MVSRIVFGALFILMNTSCNKTPYEPLYFQKYDGSDKLGKPCQMTEKTFEIKISQHPDGFFFCSYHPWLDDTYRNISFVDKRGNLLRFESKIAFEFNISKYGYEIVRSDSLYGYYTLRKIHGIAFSSDKFE